MFDEQATKKNERIVEKLRKEEFGRKETRRRRRAHRRTEDGETVWSVEEDDEVAYELVEIDTEVVDEQ